MTKPITEDAITQLYSSTLPKSLVIAHLGCSSGPNTLFIVSELIKVVDQLRRESRHDQSPEYQVFLNDLPGNDFNTIFKSSPSFQKKMSNQLGASASPCFFTGVPGSFYDRLFPSKTLHFVHSSYSLQWLSMGLIEEEKMDSSNIPQYTPSPSKVKFEVSKEGCFFIDYLEVFEVNWRVNNTSKINSSDDQFCDGNYNVAKCMKVVAEPLLVSHFGDAIIEAVFRRYRKILSNRISKENT
ncbi:hypothetical protein CIPAW_07G048700 [Carya illinoinensis]|uniref:Uncharacterized protein n=1 Tax=Carya illinoinensis TaxID=32201 RepID=A0A8T1PZZ2_CARIL|nr:hypothetical protein CIPAW_07G048700 [Carya illinoinensis]